MAYRSELLVLQNLTTIRSLYLVIAWIEDPAEVAISGPEPVLGLIYQHIY
jgi:hypothetical protein